jgi:acyl-CoA thioester hydrolase
VSADPPRYPYTVAWSDLDANVHMRNTGYLDYAAQSRFLYLAGQGFTPEEFKAAGIGPVVFSDEVRYLRELRFLEEFSVTIELGGINAEGSKFILVNRFLKTDGTVSAEVSTRGAWFNLHERRVTVPPQALTHAMLRLPHTDPFEQL